MQSFIASRKKNRRNSLMIDKFDYSIESRSFDDIHHSFSERSERSKAAGGDTGGVGSEAEDGSFRNSVGDGASISTAGKTEYMHSSELVCSMCKQDNKKSLIILSCGHIFHINCLGEAHAQNKKGVIDKEFLLSQECDVCHKQIDLEDISHIHNKYLKSLKTSIEEKDTDISLLNKKMSIIKEDLRIFYELKQRLESQRDVSKQISMVASTLL